MRPLDFRRKKTGKVAQKLLDPIILSLKVRKLKINNILFITYHYPPSSAVGGLRIHRFSNYFSKFGWSVYIVTIKNKYLPQVDYGRCKKNESIKIFQTILLPKLSIVILDLMKHGYKKYKRKENYSLSTNSDSTKTHDVIESAYKKLKRFIDSFLLLPDENRNWILPALFVAYKIIKKNNIKIVFTSCPPYSSHIVGLILKNILKIKWIADYRDPWTTPFNKYLYPTSKASLRIEKYIENMVIRKADMVTSTTENFNKKLNKTFGNNKNNKFNYIPNGFNKEVYKKSIRKYDIFTVTYAGTFYFGRSPEPIFNAIKQLKEEGKIKKNDIKIKIIGNCQYINGVKTKNMIRNYNLFDDVELQNTINYQSAVRIIQKSHLGIVLAPNQPFQIPAKLYDIIGSGTRVLGIADNGATKTMVENLDIGKCFHWKDISGIKEFIWKEINSKEKRYYSKKKNINMFDERVISKRLALIIESIL